ncbi:hypothetical protein R1479_04341 [Ralstonia mannitolilytica]|nr:hypothetical protein R1479_04341 [Ralstonia mannitolilytica]
MDVRKHVRALRFLQERHHGDHDEQRFKAFAQQDRQGAQEGRQRIVSAAQRVLGFGQHGLQTLSDFLHLPCLSGCDGVAVQPHRLFDVLEQRLVLGGQGGLNRLEAVEVGGKRKARGGRFVTLVEGGHAFLQLVLGNRETVSGGRAQHVRSASEVSGQLPRSIRAGRLSQRRLGRLAEFGERGHRAMQLRAGRPQLGAGLPIRIGIRQGRRKIGERPAIVVGELREARHRGALDTARDDLLEREDAALLSPLMIGQGNGRRTQFGGQNAIGVSGATVAGRTLILIQRGPTLEVGHLAGRHWHRIGCQQAIRELVRLLTDCGWRGFVGDLRAQCPGILEQCLRAGPRRQLCNLALRRMRKFLHFGVLVGIGDLPVLDGAAVIDRQIIKQLPDLLGLVLRRQRVGVRA